MYNAGDILLYCGDPNNAYDIAIVNVTHSKFVHAAVALNDVQKIEALSGGIMLNNIDNMLPAAVWSFVDHEPNYERDQLHSALNWLICQRGNAYSWGDAANVLLNHLHSPIEFATNNLVFCSGLCVEFLQRAGCVEVMGLDYHKVTPAMLASQLNIN